MKKHSIPLIVGTLALALSACGGGGGAGVGSDAVQGRVTYRGAAARGATVVACNVADDCATGGAAEAGVDGGYRITGLRAGQQYAVLAVMDADGDGTADLGGVYGGQNPAPVTPPRGGVDIALQAASAQSLGLKVPGFAR